MTALLLCFAISAASETKTVIYDFSADKTTVGRKDGITLMEGNAKIKVRDSEDYLNADTIKIYRDVETNELIKMEATGNVDMNQQGMKATCQKAIFYEKEDRIEMEGTEENPAVVEDGENKMVAPAITYYRAEDRIEASGNVTGQVTIEVEEEKPAEDVEEE
jgi:lipopolysaccharide export system protein LptA